MVSLFLFFIELNLNKFESLFPPYFIKSNLLDNNQSLRKKQEVWVDSDVLTNVRVGLGMGWGVHGVCMWVGGESGSYLDACDDVSSLSYLFST